MISSWPIGSRLWTTSLTVVPGATSKWSGEYLEKRTVSSIVRSEPGPPHPANPTIPAIPARRAAASRVRRPNITERR